MDSKQVVHRPGGTGDPDRSNIMVTFTDLAGQAKTVDKEKAKALLGYIQKRIAACQDTVKACKQIKDAKGEAKYLDQIEAMTKIVSQISAQLF